MVAALVALCWPAAVEARLCGGLDKLEAFAVVAELLVPQAQLVAGGWVVLLCAAVEAEAAAALALDNVVTASSALVVDSAAAEDTEDVLLVLLNELLADKVEVAVVHSRRRKALPRGERNPHLAVWRHALCSSHVWTQCGHHRREMALPALCAEAMPAARSKGLVKWHVVQAHRTLELARRVGWKRGLVAHNACLLLIGLGVVIVEPLKPLHRPTAAKGRGKGWVERQRGY